MFKMIAKAVLGNVHKYIDSLTDADLQKIADLLNKKIGGDRKIEYASLKIIVVAVRTLLDLI